MGISRQHAGVNLGDPTSDVKDHQLRIHRAEKGLGGKGCYCLFYDSPYGSFYGSSFRQTCKIQ